MCIYAFFCLPKDPARGEVFENFSVRVRQRTSIFDKDDHEQPFFMQMQIDRQLILNYDATLVDPVS